MPVVRMIDHISGGRWDGRDWPPAHGEIEVPDWEARDLIAGRLAVPAGHGAGTSAGPAPQAEVPAQHEPGAGTAAAPVPGTQQLPGVPPPEVSPVTEVSPVAEVPGETAPEPGPEPVPEPEPEPEPEPPAPHDVKQRWIDYAVLRGANPEAAAAMTKADLMSKYGGRL
jgi:hypothetical protein